jgi:hypothetical protein
VRGARLAETSETPKQGGTISLQAAVPTVVGFSKGRRRRRRRRKRRKKKKKKKRNV